MARARTGRVAGRRGLNCHGDCARSSLTPGFPWALRTAGFIALALFAVGSALVRTRLPRKTPTTWRKVFLPFRETPFILLTASVSAVFWG